MLPKAVQEAAERAEAAHQQITGNTKPNEAPAPETVVQEKPAESPAPAPVAENADTTKPANTGSSDWEHKYRVLSNKYSAEVPRMAQEIRELKAKLEEANGKLTANQKPSQDLPGSLTPEEVVERFGEDFAAAVGAVAARVASQHTGKLRDELAPKVESVVSTASVKDRKDFMASLTRAVPDWAVIDQEDGFTAYLDEVDPLTGYPRRRFFSEADASNDADRVIGFFRDYREKSAAQKDGRAERSRQAVESQIAPDSVRATSAPSGKRVWTQNDVRKFYTDARRGIFKPSEFEQIESDINAAIRDGRYVAA